MQWSCGTKVAFLWVLALCVSKSLSQLQGLLGVWTAKKASMWGKPSKRATEKVRLSESLTNSATLCSSTTSTSKISQLSQLRRNSKTSFRSLARLRALSWWGKKLRLHFPHLKVLKRSLSPRLLIRKLNLWVNLLAMDLWASTALNLRSEPSMSARTSNLKEDSWS